MRIAISGASGLVGKKLCAALAASGHTVLRLVRVPALGERADEIPWEPARGQLDAGRLAGLDGFVHLSGESVAGGRWSAARKRAIGESRLVSTRLVAETLARVASRPILVCASAVGFYGDRGSEWLDETSPPGRGFLAELCVQWERACEPARAAGLRAVNVRIGIVLDPDGGALPPMALQFRLGLGGRIASGRQYVSWITSDDLVAAIQHALASPALAGPLNAVAPAPVTNAELTRALASALHRPAFFTVPAAVLRLALGTEMADETLLGGARVRCAKLAASGFSFRDPELDPALRRLLKSG
jgi:uncharacterized protein (TIGR01777 family)